MYSDLVKRLRTMCPEDYNNLMDFTYGAGQAMAEAADAIEELSKLAEVNAKRAMKWAADAEKAEETLRWIPVTERLPEEKRDGFSDDVLMLVENPDGDITWKDVYVGYYLYDATSAETGWWAMMTCDCVKIGEHKYGSKVFPSNEYVTHWMPLPEPPKEETPTGPYDLLYEEGGANTT